MQSDKPILVTQGMDCEPTLASAIPVDAASDVQVFTLAPNFDHMLAIVRKNDGSGHRVMLDLREITAPVLAGRVRVRGGARSGAALLRHGRSTAYTR